MFSRFGNHPVLTLAFALLLVPSFVGVAYACSEESPEEVTRRIFVGGPAKADSCTGMSVSVGTVMPLKSGAHLSVRAAPDIKAKELDRLKSDHPMYMCTALTKGRWVGIIYSEDPKAELSACAGPFESSKRTAYRGPCRSGWVAKRYVWNAAG